MVEYVPGRVSLTAVRHDRRDRIVPVYLVNDTDAPLPGVVRHRREAVSQCRPGAFWLNDQQPEGGCAPPPAGDLPPRSAIVLRGRTDPTGKQQCERRFAFELDGKVLTTASMVDACDPEAVGRLLDEDTSMFLEHHFKHAVVTNNLTSGFDLAEFATVLELVRHWNQSPGLRRNCAEWVVRTRTENLLDGEDFEAFANIVRTLGDPWIHCDDRQSLAEHAYQTLTGFSSESGKEVTSHRAAIWALLAESNLAAARSSYTESTLPTDEVLTRLARLADATLRKSADPREQRCVARYLASPAVSSAHLPDSQLRDYLASGNAVLITTAMKIMPHRGLLDEAGIWISQHLELPPALLASAYSALSEHNFRDTARWEYPVMERLLETSAFHTFHSNRQRLDKLPTDTIPVAWVEMLKRHLAQEAVPEKRAWWKSVSNKLIENPDNSGVTDEIRGLAAGIRYFGRWAPNADVTILRAYLDHPAAIFTPAGKGFGYLEFLPSDAARDALIRLGQPVPSKWKATRFIVTASQGENSGSKDSQLRCVWIIAATLALSAIPIMAWRKRASKF